MSPGRPSHLSPSLISVGAAFYAAYSSHQNVSSATAPIRSEQNQRSAIRDVTLWEMAQRVPSRRNLHRRRRQNLDRVDNKNSKKGNQTDGLTTSSFTKFRAYETNLAVDGRLQWTHCTGPPSPDEMLAHSCTRRHGPYLMLQVNTSETQKPTQTPHSLTRRQAIDSSIVSMLSRLLSKSHQVFLVSQWLWYQPRTFLLGLAPGQVGCRQEPGALQ